jgi:hypothetical protein
MVWKGVAMAQVGNANHSSQVALGRIGIRPALKMVQLFETTVAPLASLATRRRRASNTLVAALAGQER